MNIVEPIFSHCRMKPAEIALAAPGTALNLLSYGRLERSINNVCLRVNSAGLKPGDRVAVFIEDNILHAIILLALTRLGIVTLSGRNKNFPKHFGISAVISDKAFTFPANKIILADLDWVTKGDAPLDGKYLYRAAPNDLCRIFLTSATTGDEKAVAVTHGEMAERVARQFLQFGSVASSSSRKFVDLSLTTSLGFQLLIGTLWQGGALFLNGEPQATIQAIPIYKIQSMFASSGGLMDFLGAVEKRPQYESALEAVWSGGSQVTTALSERVRARLCSNFTIAYGSTEAAEVASMPARMASGIQGAVGYVLPGIQVDIVGEDDVPLPVGKEGAVRIKSSFGASEYLGDPSASARAFRNGWFFPGDLGYLTKDNMLVISGRSHTILNVGGEKISPEKIEEVLVSHPSVGQAAILALSSELGVDQVCALIVPRSYMDIDALRTHCAGRLPKHFVPAQFVAVNEIPKNVMGKIDRDKLMGLLKSKLQ